MPSGVVGSLLVKLGAATAEFDRAMDASSKKVTGFENAVGKVAIGTALGNGISKGFDKAMELASRASEYMFSLIERMDAAADNAANIGIGADTYLMLSRMATQAGVSIDSVGTAIQKLKRNIADRKDIVEQLGLSPEKLSTMGVEQAFASVVGVVSEIQNPMERARVETELFGKSGYELDSIVMKIGKNFEQMKASVPGAKEIEQIAAVQDQMEELQFTLENAAVKAATAWQGFWADQIKFHGQLIYGKDYGKYFDEALENSSKKQARAAEIQMKHLAEIRKAYEEIGLQIDNVGKKESERMMNKFLTEHPSATPDEIKGYAALVDQFQAVTDAEKQFHDNIASMADATKEAMKEWDQMAEAGKRIAEQADPILMFTERLKQLREALGQGLISSEQYEKAAKKEREKTVDEFAKDLKKQDLVEALVSGTKEAYNAVARNNMISPQIVEAKKTNAKLDEIKKLLDFRGANL